jgi:hypothetical protein
MESTDGEIEKIIHSSSEDFSAVSKGVARFIKEDKKNYKFVNTCVGLYKAVYQEDIEDIPNTITLKFVKSIKEEIEEQIDHISQN